MIYGTGEEENRKNQYEQCDTMNFAVKSSYFVNVNAVVVPLSKLQVRCFSGP